MKADPLSVCLCRSGVCCLLPPMANVGEQADGTGTEQAKAEGSGTAMPVTA